MAKQMELNIPHRFDTDEARARMEALGEYYQNKYSARVSWSGNRANIKAKQMMVTIDATLILEDGRVRLEGKDPGRLLRKKAENYLRGKLQKYLDPNTPVDKLPRRP